MSLRDRFRPADGAFAPAEAADRAEARAASALTGKRGRMGIAPPPPATKAVSALLRPLMRETGMGLNELKRRWAEVAGESFARATPEKLAAGVLTLKAPGALAPFLQQQAPLLIERLKVAGAKVKSVRIEQRTAAAQKNPNVRPLKRALTTAEEAALKQALDPVGDDGLKSALMRLGRAVKQG
ncbi:MAG: DciA family protein [Hyphomonadaceae bacterium]